MEKYKDGALKLLLGKILSQPLLRLLQKIFGVDAN